MPWLKFGAMTMLDLLDSVSKGRNTLVLQEGIEKRTYKVGNGWLWIRDYDFTDQFKYYIHTLIADRLPVPEEVQSKVREFSHPNTSEFEYMQGRFDRAICEYPYY